MSSLYPSLEDMKVDGMMQAQNAYTQPAQPTPAVSYPTASSGAPPAYSTEPSAPKDGASLYPSLDDYMGLSLSPEVLEQHMTNVVANPIQTDQVALRSCGAGHMQVAPITGDNIGLRRAEVKQGVREVVFCKDGDGKLGLRVRAVNRGIFIAFVHKDSAAALAGLRFGDQIVQINNENTAGWDTDKAMKVLKKAAGERIVFAVRDRPFERTLTMHKDSSGHIGFVFKNGEVTALMKDSSAARNGMLTEHQLVEIDGQNVVGMKDKEIGRVIADGREIVTVTIIPCYIYKHIIKSMGTSLMTKLMDHSVPDV